jgi:hypothetical protein
MLCLILSTKAGFAQENTLSSMWDLLEPGEVSLGVRDGRIVDTSSGKDPKAPATATLMRAGGPCRAEVSGAVQWPSEWAALTTTSHDFRKVSGCGFYAETGTLDLSKPSLSPNDPRVQTIVLIGKGFVCNQGVHLKPGAQTINISAMTALSSTSSRLPTDRKSFTRWKNCRRHAACLH